MYNQQNWHFFNLTDMVPGGFLKQLTFIKFYTDKSMNLSPHLKDEKKNHKNPKNNLFL